MKKIGICIDNNCITTTWLAGGGIHIWDDGWDVHQGIMWIQSRKDGPCSVGLNLLNGTHAYSRRVRSKNEH